ncbi:unnamed protein product [Rotaria magnacalcarata]|uniref:Uncharacterized protein n=1 Tax=Rotaria magnacalcarata TaxID=392030 RepID=A0A819XMX0_9BILA|nr:unnamed protein product [Rotaria magnacalcarata]
MSDRFTNQIHIMPSQLTLTNLRPTKKRKANQIDDSEQLIEENNPSTKTSARIVRNIPRSLETFQGDSDR